jgi:glyoxylase-like metal-dependent hydrolase (beta-lactamase superfamily II)
MDGQGKLSVRKIMPCKLLDADLETRMFRYFAVAALGSAFALTASAQDARAALESALKAMGFEKTGSVRYTGSGMNYAFGQAYSPGAAWPKFNVKSYERTDDFDADASGQKMLRTQAENPPRGGGLQPLIGEQTQSTVLGEKLAWADKFDLYMSPLGFLKGALANSGTVTAKTVGTKKFNAVSFTVDKKYKVDGYLNEQNELEKVETMVDNPVVGDMRVVATFSDYKDFNGLRFPSKIVETQGGFPVYDLTITDVKKNVIAGVVPPAKANEGPQVIDEALVAPDVYYFTGGTHHSVVVGFNDYIVVIEGPLDEERSEAVIAEAKKLFLNKPIRYLINTHAHFDHAGGIRTYAAEGATILTYQSNKPYYEKVFATPRTLSPDKLSRAKPAKKAVIEAVAEKRILTDGTHEIDLYHVQNIPPNGGHSDSMLIAYLPRDKVLVEADLYTAPVADPGAPPPDPKALAPPVSPYTLSLVENLNRLKLAPEKILGLHGRAATKDELMKAAGK